MKKIPLYSLQFYYTHLSFAQKVQDTTKKVQTVKSRNYSGKEKLIERKADRLVFNVEASM